MKSTRKSTGIIKNIFATAAISFMALSVCQTAYAGGPRTFVATFGSDANTGTLCLSTAPCRTFAAAVGATSAGGEVVALDSGGFGPFTITQAITISGAPGVYAAVGIPLGGVAINVNATSSDKIYLRNLHLDGSTGGASGIGIQMSGGTLTVVDTEINRFGRGVSITGGAADFRGLILTNNVVGVRAQGQGPDQDSFTNGVTPRVTVVRIGRSTIVDNTTAFQMIDPGSNPGGDNTTPGVGGAIGGTRASGSNNAQNIFLNNEGNTNTPNSYITGNTTFLTVTGNAEFNGTSASANPTIGFFASQSQQSTFLTPANQ